MLPTISMIMTIRGVNDSAAADQSYGGHGSHASTLA